MARPRRYDPEEALDRAVEVFWERGYGDTSVQDLVDATGVQRYGLYESFGDKRELFLAALRRYERVWITGILGSLESEDASLPELLAFFERLKAAPPHRDSPDGCLLCNTATELGGEDADADAVVQEYVQRLHSVFRAALERAVARGEVGGEIEPVRYSQFLAGVVLGVGVHKRTVVGHRALEAFVDTALAALT